MVIASRDEVDLAINGITELLREESMAWFCDYFFSSVIVLDGHGFVPSMWPMMSRPISKVSIWSSQDGKFESISLSGSGLS